MKLSPVDDYAWLDEIVTDMLLIYMSIFRYLWSVIFLSFTPFCSQFNIVICYGDCSQLNFATISSWHLKQIQAAVWEFSGDRLNLLSVVKSLTRQIRHSCRGLLSRWVNDVLWGFMILVLFCDNYFFVTLLHTYIELNCSCTE